MVKSRLLVVDDEATILGALKRHFQRQGYDVVVCPSSREAVTLLRAQSFDIVITDLRIQEANDGMQVLAASREVDASTQAIVMTAYGTVPSAVEAMRKGAFAYVEKPVDLADMQAHVERALEHRRLQRDNDFLQEELVHRTGSGEMIGEHPRMRELFQMIQRVARTEATVLLLGECGTGKELVARAIHTMSPRRERLLVPVNCAAIPGELLESELFGHVKGAFTGAHRNTVGRFEVARGGTLFLDEIGDMPVGLQAKLLRVLQEGYFEPVGSTRQIQLQARVIAATNQDLEQKILDGTFRQDLFYRLNVIPIRVPALRERPSDIAGLVRHFLRRFARQQRTQAEDMQADALDALAAYPWPGNVREVENLIQRLVVLNPDRRVFTLEDLPSRYRGGRTRTPAPSSPLLELPEEGLQLKDVLDRLEEHFLDLALERTSGNRNQAAKLLGLKRTTLVEKLKKRGRECPGEDGEERQNTPPPHDSWSDR